MGFRDTTGIRHETVGVWLTTDERHENSNGGVHGGALMTLLDSAMGRAVREAVGSEPTIATMDMSTSFLSPAQIGDQLGTVCTVLRASKRHATVLGEVRRDDGTLVAHAQATFVVMHHGKHGGQQDD